MKKIVGLFILISSITYGQNFTGRATYKTHRKVDIKMNEGKNAPNSEIQKQLHEQLKRQFQKTFTLEFDNYASTYKQEAQLSAPQPTNGVQIQIIGNGGGTDVLYKNVKDKRYVNKTEISGKRFLIKDNLSDLGWEMTGETKTIGKYTCYKAERSREEERRSFSVNEEGKEEDKTEKVTVKTVAWYTPEIPVSNGPGLHWGLPGLILEIQDGKQTIVCSEIVINPSDKVVIEEPTKGKKVTQQKFDKIMDEKSKEMMERFKNKRKSRGNDGNSISIEIQG
ncbi:GLPGLI family protein [uncultured Tenacibaculum sp.]|uniref:GLPGLI family protein n=1 Tax=uncultured Tenacibaculum sp. TaxID=174713 RepID=UPI00260A8A36|nr:GLPGLI family protein [uncultured Tenacibaculum sp.]